MAEKNDGMANKPFYENIVGKKKRVDGKPADKKGAGATDGERGERGAKRRPDADARDRPRDGERFAGLARDSARPARDSARPARDSTRPARDSARPARDSARPARDSARPARDHARPEGPGARRTGPGNERPRGNWKSDDRSGLGERRGSAPRGNAPATREARPRRNSFVPPRELDPVFGDLSADTRALLEAFPDIAQSVMPLDSKRLQQLPTEIRELSHSLTDERGDRRIGYMNEPATLSAYVRYYMWWNLVRLTRLFSSLPFSLADGDAAVDLGSGPLTVPIALWMARPDLREKKLTWYCVDISQGSLAVGEDLFLSLAAKTACEPWQIVRIKGEAGTPLRRRVSLVASANMFNELFWDNPTPLEQQAKHHARDLESYAAPDSSILVVEPGVPRAGRFVSLLRDAFIRAGFEVQSPCPHAGNCPFPGLRNGKWCHFVLDTADAPARLHRLSEDAGLSKDRAALSFVYASREAIAAASDDASDAAIANASVTEADAANDAEKTDPSSMVSRMSRLVGILRVRVTSDPIRLPDYYTGRYGCSEIGMVMLAGTYGAADYLNDCRSGTLVEVPMPNLRKAERDGKTGAIIIRL